MCFLYRCGFVCWFQIPKGCLQNLFKLKSVYHNIFVMAIWVTNEHITITLACIQMRVDYNDGRFWLKD